MYKKAGKWGAELPSQSSASSLQCLLHLVKTEAASIRASPFLLVPKDWLWTSEWTCTPVWTSPAAEQAHGYTHMLSFRPKQRAMCLKNGTLIPFGSRLTSSEWMSFRTLSSAPVVSVRKLLISEDEEGRLDIFSAVTMYPSDTMRQGSLGCQVTE